MGLFERLPHSRHMVVVSKYIGHVCSRTQGLQLSIPSRQTPPWLLLRISPYRTARGISENHSLTHWFAATHLMALRLLPRSTDALRLCVCVHQSIGSLYSHIRTCCAQAWSDKGGRRQILRIPNTFPCRTKGGGCWRR